MPSGRGQTLERSWAGSLLVDGAPGWRGRPSRSWRDMDEGRIIEEGTPENSSRRRPTSGRRPSSRRFS